jgi:tetratricopeptide (TPR) repeat protein
MPRRGVNTVGKRPKRRRRVTLPYMPSPELDYAAGFQRLAKLHLKVRRGGLTKALAVQRAHVLFSLGNPLGAAFDCERALRLDPTFAEAHFVKGQAMLAMAGVKEGLVQPGPGTYLPHTVLPPRRDLLMAAEACFEKALFHNPDDPQALRALAATTEMMAMINARDLRSARPVVAEPPVTPRSRRMRAGDP